MRAQTGREARARATASRRERNRGEGERRKKKRKRTRPACLRRQAEKEQEQQRHELSHNCESAATQAAMHMLGGRCQSRERGEARVAATGGRGGDAAAAQGTETMTGFLAKAGDSGGCSAEQNNGNTGGTTPAGT
jgi:hypothetical protein